MSYTFADQDGKVILHSWGRFRATVLAAVVVGDLLGRKSATTTSMQLANEASTSVVAEAIACQNIAAGETGWCALAVEVKAPVSIGTGGVVTRTYFDNGTNKDIGQSIYLSDAGKISSSPGGTTVQVVGFNPSRDRLVIVPGGLLTGGITVTTLTASGVVSLTDVLNVTGVLTTTAEQVSNGGIQIAATKGLGFTGQDYTSDGAIATKGLVTLSKTGTLAMTLAAPVAGDLLIIHDKANGSADNHVVSADAASAKFDVSGNDILTFNAADETVVLLGVSATRWVIIENIDSVALSGA